MNRLSGDQKTGGPRAFSVPGNGCGSSESRARVQTRLRPSEPGAKNASLRPSGDSVKVRLPAGSRTSKRTGAATGDLLPRYKNPVRAAVALSRVATLQA